MPYVARRKTAMIPVAEICAALEEYAPAAHAESYDNVGLLVGDATARVSRALVVLDVTERVVEYASENGYGLVVAHHPIWFGAKKRLTGDDFSSRCIVKAIRAGIALYAAHTNLDNVRHGVNAKICEKLGLENTAILSPRPGDGNVGSGMVGTFAQELSPEDFLARVKNTFRAQVVRYRRGKGTTIRRVAVCGGAGSFLIPAAEKAEVDALITADVSYHKFFDADFFLLDVGHYESEQYTIEILLDVITKKFPNFEVGLPPFDTNPVSYYF